MRRAKAQRLHCERWKAQHWTAHTSFDRVRGMDTAEKTSSTTSEQIEFAWHNFEDQQAIIRAADLKAGYLVPFLLFFGASTIPLGTEVVPKMRFGDASGAVAAGLYILAYMLLVAGFVWSLLLISRALTPRIARHHQSPQEGASLLYYEHVLRHKDNGGVFRSDDEGGPGADAAEYYGPGL